MRERSLRAIIAVAVTPPLLFLGVAIMTGLPSRKAMIPFIIAWVVLVAAVVAYGIYHARRGRSERIDRASAQAPQHRNSVHDKRP